MSKSDYALPLQQKVSLSLVTLIIAFTLVSFAVLKVVIAPAFDELEVASAEANLKRVEAAIVTDMENLAAITADWAPWDEIYSYVTGRNPGFHKSSLDRPTLTNLGLDLMAIYSRKGEYVWGQLLVNGDELPINTLNILDTAHPSSKTLTQHVQATDQVLGFVDTAAGPMIVSSRPIVRSDDSGPIAGALVMGQLLSDARLARLRERTGVDVGWQFDGQGPASFVEVSEGFVFASKVLQDINGAPLLVLQARTPRRIAALGLQTINAALLSLVLAGVLVCGLIWFILKYTILRPVEQLASHIDDIRTSGDLTRQLQMNRNDEIGMLAQQFDSMTAEVHETRRALLDQSYKAGKADTAAEVMHNIRNAMTPMINGLDRLKRNYRIADNLRVPEAIDELSDPDCGVERRDKFLQYIDASFNHIRKTGQGAVEDLNIVTAQARQVEGILFDQEKFTNVDPVSENLRIDELLNEAANVIPKADSQDLIFDVDQGMQRVRVTAHRIGLLQVLGNLILNAYESIRRTDQKPGQISLQAADELIDDKAMVRLTVRDNGAGFDEDIGEQIFQRGYTSKTQGDATGLGLHWCANAVASMGGRISARSEGQGCGAEFHVLLPAAQGG